MKKLLLFAASALMGLSSAFAQTAQRYHIGNSISDLSDIQEGMSYYLHAKQPDRNISGCITTGNNPNFTNKASGMQELVEDLGDNTSNTNYLWKFIKVTEGEHAGCYKIQNVNTLKCWSNKGGNGSTTAQGNILWANGPTDTNAAIVTIEAVPVSGNYDNNDFTVTNTEGHIRFWIRQTLPFGGTDTSKPKPCVALNGSGNTGTCTWYPWESPMISNPNKYVQFEIVEAIAESATNVTVNLPAINGWPVSIEPLQIYPGDDVTTAIRNKLDNLGGMANATITSNKEGDSENMTVAEDNKSFTVTGTWDRELIANHVYRITMKPGDRPAAMRYELLSQKISTISGYDEVGEPNTLTRLVPERLWFFKPVEGKEKTYTLHTLYDAEHGIYIEDNDKRNFATLSDDEHPATEFKVNQSTWNTSVANDNVVGDFYLTFGSGNGLNEYENYVSLWHGGSWGGDHGSAFRLTPLSSDDLETLKLNDGTEPTVDEVAKAIADFNSTNVNAALRRIKYMNANDADMFGTYVGQYNNEKGDARELYEQAVAIVGGQEASDEAKQAIVDGLDPTKLTFKDLVPNRFYRFKNKVSDQYISSISSFTNSNKRAYMDLTDDGTRSNTVFLYHQEGEGDAAVNTLVCFDDGKVMPSFAGSNWVPVLKTDSDAAEGTHLTYQDNGRYVIHVSNSDDSGHRHLYGAGDTQGNAEIVDAAGDNTGVKYQWYIDEVTELPVTFFNVVDTDPNHDDDGWSSVCVPVALEFPDDGHITAYTGTFVQDVNADKGDVQHILATEIPSVDGKVTIPAGQVALLYYDGKADIAKDDNYDFSAMQATRGDIIYARIPINYDYEGELTEKGNLTGGYFAFNQEENKEYYTLHASYNNYFRQLSSYTTTVEGENGETQEVEYFDFVPGFKAYLEVDHDNTEFYQVSAINPNGIVPEVTGAAGAQGLTVDKGSEEGKHQVTVTLDRSDYVVYYKHTPYPTEENADQPMSVRRRAEGDLKAGQTEGFSEADHVEGSNEHTFVVEPGSIEYYAYHPASNTTGAVRSFEITEKGDAVSTSLKSVLVNMNGKQVIFDLQGRRMGAPVKGVSIINGKKTYVK